MSQTLLVGADPELFLLKNDAFHSGWGIIPGNKADPFKVHKGAVQVDGMALEFNIDPAPDFETFANNIDTVMGTLREMVPAEFHLSITPTATFSAKHLKEQPQEALICGCDPDYNAYTLEENPMQELPGGFRTAGGHLHIGWRDDAREDDLEHIETCAAVVKEMDARLGIPSLYLDKDNKRRALYGRAGAFRPKPYGVEYRVLSNFWLRSREYMEFVYNAAVKSFKALETETAGHKELEELGLNVETIINQGKITSIADYCIHQLKIRLPKREQ